jgi:Domain of unknown function (DUF4386)
MAEAVLKEHVSQVSARGLARVAGLFYLLTFVTGSLALTLPRGRVAMNLVADVCYVAVALFFYAIFKPVSRRISMLAAIIGLAGCALSAVDLLRIAPPRINALVVFGVYCLLIGYLIMRSQFLPRVLGALMAIGGLGWLTFISSAFAQTLSPYNFAPGMIGEGALTLWLLIKGVNAEAWKHQAGEVRTRAAAGGLS